MQIDLVQFLDAPLTVKEWDWYADVDERPTGWSYKRDDATWTSEFLGWEGTVDVTKVAGGVPVRFHGNLYAILDDDTGYIEDYSGLQVDPPDVKLMDGDTVLYDLAKLDDLTEVFHEHIIDSSSRTQLPSIDHPEPPEADDYDRRHFDD